MGLVDWTWTALDWTSQNMWNLWTELHWQHGTYRLHQEIMLLMDCIVHQDLWTEIHRRIQDLTSHEMYSVTGCVCVLLVVVEKQAIKDDPDT